MKGKKKDRVNTPEGKGTIVKTYKGANAVIDGKHQPYAVLIDGWRFPMALGEREITLITE